MWADYHIPDRRGHTPACQLVELAAENDIPLMIASHSLKDFWYLLWQDLKMRNRESGKMSAENASAAARVVAWAVIKQLLEVTTVVGSDNSDAWIASKLQGVHSDYEDNLVIAAALRAKPEYLVTNDQALIAHSPVATATPEDAVKYLETL